MTKLPRVSGKELVRALERGGFVVHRQRGSHLMLYRPGSTVTAVVPVHANQDLPVGTLRAILRQAELTADELVDLLDD